MKAFITAIKTINRMKLSGTAKSVFLELACESNANKPLVFIDIKALANSLERAVSTIRSAVKELVDLGLIVFEGIFVQLKHKVYRIVFGSPAKTKPEVTKAKPPEPKVPAAPQIPDDRLVFPPNRDPNDKTVRYEDYQIPRSRTAEAPEIYASLYRLGLSKSYIFELLAVEGFSRCRELINEYANAGSLGRLGIHPETWFRNWQAKARL